MRDSKRSARLRRASRGRQMSVHHRKYRLVAHRSGSHIYAQIVGPDARIVASASTVEKEMRAAHKHGNTIAAAAAVGERIAAKAKEASFDEQVTFDRSGFKYHGRIKALADSARSGGIRF